KWPEAIDYIERARAAAPNDPAPGIALVNLYGLRRDWKAAGAITTQPNDKVPSNPRGLDAQRRTPGFSGGSEGASATFKRLHELVPNSLPILSRYLAALNAAKNYSQARSVLQAALERDPKNGAMRGDLIRAEAEIGGLDAGLAKARAFAKDDPQNAVYDL